MRWWVECARLVRSAILAVVAVLATAVWPATSPALAADAPTPARVEARSADLLAVGIVHSDRMSIHLSRLIDNSPVRDALLTVMVRGVVHPTVAEADGSYTLQDEDLTLPGSATIEFQIVRGTAREDLKGTLSGTAGEPKPEPKNSARQLGWWILNFAVCIGFLWLWSRRRAAPQDP